MARHIMAVCVVCLLCADRLPCEQHLQELNPATYVQSLDTEAKLRGAGSTTERDPYNKVENIYRPPRGEEKALHYRRRRHASHASQDAHPDAAEETCSPPKLTEVFLQRIVDKFGNEEKRLGKNEFQHLLGRLGLHQLASTQGHQNSTCISDDILVHLVQQHGHTHLHHNYSSTTQNKNVNCSSNIGSPSAACATEWGEYLQQNADRNYTLSTEDLYNVCPVLLYQVAASSLSESESASALKSELEPQSYGCIDYTIVGSIESSQLNELFEEHVSTVHIWIYAFASVFACSILGLMGVAIIPFMDSRYYKHIIQFLVGLAVGTMTGDALLHLLPHSLIGQSERNMVLKGLTAMGGIIFFYITEHGLTMISEWRKSIAKKEPRKPSRVKVMREPDVSINNSVGGDKLCKSKYSSYPYCYDEIAMDTKNEMWMHLPTHNETCELGAGDVDRRRNGKTEAAEAGEMAAQSLLATSHNNYTPVTETTYSQQQQQQQQRQHLPGSNTISTDLDGSSLGDGVILDGAAANGNNSKNTKEKDKPLVPDTVTVILREHESSHHGHSHKHGHVHSPPASLSAVAWMIIMGDGLHNFTDGMAIGAAFADNMAGGFSTSLAVFCHELPHELGDFAILIKAGMSVKSAVYYNLLTGVLSFIGMIFGIVFGQSQEAAQWMFAAAAGLFIYIALVDMMPELSATHKSLEQFVLQIAGMSSGVLLMLLIAMYEDDLLNVFSSTPIH